MPSDMVNQDPTMLQGSQEGSQLEGSQKHSGKDRKQEEGSDIDSDGEEERIATPSNEEVLNQSDDEGDDSVRNLPSLFDVKFIKKKILYIHTRNLR